MTNSFRTGALVVAAALAGGVTAYAVDSTHSDTRTIIRTASPAATTVSAPPQQGLSVNQIYRKDAPGVVVVTATTTTTTSNQFDPFGAPQQQQGQALGSGFVIDKSGHILTNAHVVLNASKVQVAFGADATSRTYDAKVLGIDRSTDVAVLKVDAPAEALTPLALGNSSDVQVGDPVVAIGNPLGEARTATTGIVSAVNRDIGSLQGNVQIRGAIQTDAAINHGNSGGPLINDEGQVIGITSQILSDDPNNPQSGSIGIGFAVPINTVKTVADQIITSGKAQHTYLGILGSEITPNLAQALNLGVDHGVLIGKVESGSPAAKAGLKAGTTQATIQGQTMTLGGDIITSIDGKQIRTFDDLSGGIAAKKPGDTVQLGIYRDGKQTTVTVTLAAR
ncbi:MAG TPA: trypsin-like peptidase domain-containing protein [Gaiellales bacterium]|nr:trypsin-like peptidase domain-containing protein [Gaiellales bacterium]